MSDEFVYEAPEYDVYVNPFFSALAIAGLTDTNDMPKDVLALAKLMDYAENLYYNTKEISVDQMRKRAIAVIAYKLAEKLVALESYQDELDKRLSVDNAVAWLKHCCVYNDAVDKDKASQIINSIE